MKLKEYAAYKGDKFLDLGTVKELAQRLNVKENTIRWYVSHAARRRNKGNNIVVIPIDYEEDEE